MNILRLPARNVLRRTYSTFVPPAQLQNIEHSSDWRSRATEAKLNTPNSPSFYTARPAYYDQVIQLERAVSRTQGALKADQLLPLPAFARASLPSLHPVWKSQTELGDDLGTKVTTRRHRKLTNLLNQLNDYHRIARTAGRVQLADSIEAITSMYESGKKDAFLARGKRKKVVLDSYGRSYTVGKRKTGSARVWMIPVQSQSRGTTKLESMDELLDLAQSPPKVTTTTILVNNLPLNEYFPLPVDRERVTRPLKVAGVLGAYNIFAIVRGGGTTGQAGALAQGIAKAIVAHEPELETMLRRSKLTRRDPRMVERKKTGLAKARKRYTWVKR